MTEEEQVLAVKLVLVGIGIWSNREYHVRKETTRNPRDVDDSYAIVKLGTEGGDGEFMWARHAKFYPSRMAAMEAAMKLVLEKAREQS